MRQAVCLFEVAVRIVRPQFRDRLVPRRLLRISLGFGDGVLLLKQNELRHVGVRADVERNDPTDEFLNGLAHHPGVGVADVSRHFEPGRG